MAANTVAHQAALLLHLLHVKQWYLQFERKSRTNVARPTRSWSIARLEQTDTRVSFASLAFALQRGRGGTMRRIAKGMLAAACAFLLCGDVLGQEVRIPRKGSSPGFHRPPSVDPAPGWFEEDPAPCRRPAARVSEKQAKQNLVVGYLIGGLLGALITSSASEGQHTGSGSSLWGYDECRARRPMGTD